jgi:homoserine O-succinyltransferase
LQHPTPPLVCAFVNNMPDGAFLHTERQFTGLLEAACGSLFLELRRYALPGVPRGTCVAEQIGEQYLPLEQLWRSSPDAVIVTGSNPLAAELTDEPYWSDLVHLLEWSSQRAASVLLSCLAAHAALFAFDGVERRQLDAKRTGVFVQEVRRSHFLTDGIVSPLVLPHSRLNDVPSAAIESVGYEVLIGSQAIGWSVAHRRRNGCDLVLVQGHPEYDASSLLREYRRDAERFLSGARVDPPPLPIGCVAAEDEASLASFHHRISRGRRDPGLISQLPFEEMAGRAGWPWRSVAITFYANWTAGVLQGTGSGREI